jgi:hypothetical protein
MNPLASTQPVRRVLTLISTLALIILSVACGSNNNSAPSNPVGFTNSSLNGTYVFSSSGEDGLGGFAAIAGTLVANGTGGITGGTIDVVDSSFGSEPSPVAQTISSGSYEVSSDGRGQFTLKSPYGTYAFDFALASSSHGLVTEFDGNGTGSGTIDLQTAPTGISQLAGSYAFSLGGIDGNSNNFASVGSFTLDSNGNVTGGVQDFSDAGTAYSGPLTGLPASLGSGTAPGSITLTANFGGIVFDFYPIDATHLKFIETDYNQILSGDAFSQTGASIPSGTVAFTLSGGVSAPVAVGGLMTSDGTGNFAGGVEDANNNGAITQEQFTGAAASGGSVGGRVLVNLSGFSPSTQWVIYPSSGGLLMLESDSLNTMLGASYAQTSQTIAPSQNYAFNLSAANISAGLEEDDIAQFTTTSSALSGVVDVNDDTGLSFAQSLSGTYALDSPATGRGEATTSANGGAFVIFNFYVVDSSTVLVLETDTNQIGSGMFQFQTAPSGQVAQSHVALAHVPIRPLAKHRALRHK